MKILMMKTEIKALLLCGLILGSQTSIAHAQALPKDLKSGSYQCQNGFTLNLKTYADEGDLISMSQGKLFRIVYDNDVTESDGTTHYHIVFSPAEMKGQILSLTGTEKATLNYDSMLNKFVVDASSDVQGALRALSATSFEITCDLYDSIHARFSMNVYQPNASAELVSPTRVNTTCTMK